MMMKVSITAGTAVQFFDEVCPSVTPTTTSFFVQQPTSASPTPIPFSISRVASGSHHAQTVIVDVVLNILSIITLVTLL